MRQYSPKWVKVVLSAIVFHAVVIFALPTVLSDVWSEKSLEAEELTWLDVDLTDNSPSLEAEDVPTAAEEPVAEPEFQPFVMPELVIPKTVFEPLPELPPPPPPYKPIEKPAPPPSSPVEQSAPVKVQPEPKPSEPEPQQMGEPPKTLKEVQPTENLGYKGFVTVRVRIGTDGSILYSDVMRSSKREEVDAVALECARQWQFEPALDQKGRPMACDKIITFDFRKIG